MEDKFNDYLDRLESHKWVGVSDLSKQFGVSERTVFQWLKDGKIKGVKWKGRRLIDSVSVVGFLMNRKMIQVNNIKNKEMVREIELKEFQSR